MRIPVIHGRIERRILVNYRVDPDVLARVLPRPFKPKLIRGFGMAGICLIRFRQLRPRYVPSILGISSENAAHRIAVRWNEQGVAREGVYVIRRDSNSRFNTVVGGRLFPGVHHYARFQVHESPQQVRVSLASDDLKVRVSVAGRIVDQIQPESVFKSLDEASEFFEAGSIGYSPGRNEGTLEGLELNCRTWDVVPLSIDEVTSSYFEDATRFPPGSAHFDCALLMQNIEHSWKSKPALCCA